MPRTGMSRDGVRARALDLATERMRNVGAENVRLSHVANDLNVSHAALYVHFADKAALLDAVVARWLDADRAALSALCAADGEPCEKVRSWFLARYRRKRRRASDDPELYRAFDLAAQRRKPFVADHLAAMHRQLVDLLRAGWPAEAQRAEQLATLLLEATAAFHHPGLVADHAEDRGSLLLEIVDTLIAGWTGRGRGP